jgi:hypothetical protein
VVPLPKKVAEYLKELERNKDDKPEQAKDGIEIYLGLWRSAIERGVVSSSDEISAALVKVEEKGGLRRAAKG